MTILIGRSLQPLFQFVNPLFDTARNEFAQPREDIPDRNSEDGFVGECGEQRREGVRPFVARYRTLFQISDQAADLTLGKASFLTMNVQIVPQRFCRGSCHLVNEQSRPFDLSVARCAAASRCANLSGVTGYLLCSRPLEMKRLGFTVAATHHEWIIGR